MEKTRFLLLDSRDFDEFYLFASTRNAEDQVGVEPNPGVFVFDGVGFALRATVSLGDFHSDFLG